VTTSARGILNGLCFLFFFNGWIIQPALAIPVNDLDPAREWRVEAIEISGNATFSDSELTSEMLTKARPWYLFWQDAPVFDPVTFREDLERLRRFYEARGYYQTHITHDLIVDPERSQVHVKIEISEGPPVIVAEVEVEIVGSSLFPPELPIKKGQVFTEESYRKGEDVLRQFFLDRSYAYVTTERRAEVNLDRDQAYVW